ncbi:MAG: hypothetical protein JWQ38_2936 [Flavipsychrobacter sp.]|nr:hypothetical protein [Flavipsychrobacter sp.]
MSQQENNENKTGDDALANKIKHLEELNRAIAHNLRGGVSNIKLLTEMLMEKKTTKAQLKNSNLGMSTSEGLQYIHDSSLALLNSLNAFMEMSEIHLKGGLLQEKCDLAKMIRDITTQLKGSIKDDTIHVFLGVTHITYPCPYLESILYNLISNAMKYARKDVPADIAIVTYKEEGRTVLKVKDNGIGIDLNRFGDKLFKLYETFHKGYDSRGIGLYMTKAQIESLGGTITVKSKVNEGTEFTVTF